MTRKGLPTTSTLPSHPVSLNHKNTIHRPQGPGCQRSGNSYRSLPKPPNRCSLGLAPLSPLGCFSGSSERTISAYFPLINITLPTTAVPFIRGCTETQPLLSVPSTQPHVLFMRGEREGQNQICSEESTCLPKSSPCLCPEFNNKARVEPLPGKGWGAEGKIGEKLKSLTQAISSYWPNCPPSQPPLAPTGSQ